MTDLNFSRPSALRRWATRGAVVAAGLGIVAGAVAPAASAATSGIDVTYGGVRTCTVNYDVVIGPVKGGSTVSDCHTRPGKRFPANGGGQDIYSLGQVILPGGINYSAWIDKVW